MASLFTKIIQRKLPSHIVAETSNCIAFLDINPLVIGHTLVVPKQEVDSFFDLKDQDLATLMLFAKKVAYSIQKVVPCKRVGIAVIGLEVPHAHVHLIPLNTIEEINFTQPKIFQTSEELEELAKDIKNASSTSQITEE